MADKYPMTGELSAIGELGAPAVVKPVSRAQNGAVEPNVILLILLALIVAFMGYRIRSDGVGAVLARLFSVRSLIALVLFAAFVWVGLTPRMPSVLVMGSGLAFVVAILILLIGRYSGRRD